jgi:hypothetical protein
MRRFVRNSYLGSAPISGAFQTARRHIAPEYFMEDARFFSVRRLMFDSSGVWSSLKALPGYGREMTYSFRGPLQSIEAPIEEQRHRQASGGNASRGSSIRITDHIWRPVGASQFGELTLMLFAAITNLRVPFPVRSSLPRLGRDERTEVGSTQTHGFGTLLIVCRIRETI